MKEYQKMTAAAMALLMTFSSAACAKEEQSAKTTQTENIWVEDNFTDVQDFYASERPDAAGAFSLSAMQLSAGHTVDIQRDDGHYHNSLQDYTENNYSNADADTTFYQNTARKQQSEEMRAIWLSYLDLKPMLLTSGDRSVGKAQFEKNIDEAFSQMKSLGLNTVIAQVRPFGDALYDSEYFPWSYLAAGEEGKAPGFDPLEVMVEKAHEKGLRLEAWVNPYRVRNAAVTRSIAKNNPVNQMLKTGDAIKYNNAITYNPASQKAQELIVNGVREIVENYDVDGIHFDDYFYPTTDAAFDSASFKAYKNAGGTKSLAAWRRSNVDSLVKKVYAAIKAVDSEVTFGISPQGNLENNYDKQFIDVKKWLSEDGYIDYICPQIYFGFKNKTCPYEQTVNEWNSLIKNDTKLYIGLAPYKIGTEDTYAGDKGKMEWKNSGDILARMVDSARDAKHYGGFALFRYNSVFEPQSSVRSAIKEEMTNLKNLL